MRIKFTEHVPDPKLRNTIANHPAHIAQVLIASGQAVAVPYRDFRERLAAEATAASGAGHTDANVSGIEWGVNNKDPLNPSSIVRVIKRRGCETLFFSTPPDDAPAFIKQGFADLTATTTPEMLEALRVAEALERNRANESTAQEKTGFLHTVFHGDNRGPQRRTYVYTGTNATA
jgi:hypothetical protein